LGRASGNVNGQAHDRGTIWGNLSMNRSNDIESPLETKPDGKNFFTRPFVLADESVWFVLINALDFFVTYVLLAWPETPIYEANPIALAILGMGFGWFVAFKFGLTAVAIVCCEAIARRNYRLGRQVLIVLTIGVGLVVVWGASLFARHLLER
jgi:hypothetical protein